MDGKHHRFSLCFRETFSLKDDLTKPCLTGDLDVMSSENVQFEERFGVKTKNYIK